jgi:hypothetical protein
MTKLKLQEKIYLYMPLWTIVINIFISFWLQRKFQEKIYGIYPAHQIMLPHTSCNYHIQRILNNGYIFSYGQLRSFRTILYHQLYTEWIKKEISRENIYWYTYSSSHNLIPYHMVYAYIGLIIINMHITSYIMDNRIAINMSWVLNFI